jgi:GGDEF domain-containing protein
MYGKTKDVLQSLYLEAAGQLPASGTDEEVETRERYLDRIGELEVPYEGEPGQLFEMLRELPEVANALYRGEGFDAIEGFPPRLKPGMQPSEAEAKFIAGAEAWISSEENWGYAKLAGGIVLGIGATAVTGGLAGPEAAAGVGILIGAVTGGHETYAAAKRLAKMRDLNTVGAASQETVKYAENDLIGATGALAINLVTAGLASKFGGGKIAGELAKSTAKSVMKEAVTGAVIGTGTGALSTAANPNVWNSEDTFGMLLKGAVAGGAGGGAGGGLGRAASIAVSRATTPQLRVGSRVDVVLEGQTKPETFVVRELDKKTGTVVIEKDEQLLKVNVTETQLMKMNEQTSLVSRLRARFAKHEAPTAMEKREADFLDEFAQLAPGRSIEEGRALFRASAGFRNDGIKGFGVREDLAPSLELAADHVAKTAEPAIAVRGSLRNLGGINKKMPGEANAVLQDVATIFREELGKTGAKVAAFRDGPEMTFILSGKDVPKSQVDAAFVRADIRVQALAKKHGIQDLEHPKHPGEEAWMGVGISPVTAKIQARDNATLLESALDVRVVGHNAELGQLTPKPSRVRARPAQPVPSTTVPKDTGRTPKLLDAVEQREQLFVDNAKNLGIEEGAARALFQKSRSLLLDEVTGYAGAEDRGPTVQRAIDFAKKQGENAHYVEIDVRNLGGLNNAVGKKAADGDFAVAARLIKEEMGGVGADTAFFRHGGDEMSVVAVGPGVKKADVDAAMTRAGRRFDRYIEDRGLSEIPHTKAGKGPGVGFTHATETAQHGDDAASLMKRAVESCESKKAAKVQH